MLTSVMDWKVNRLSELHFLQIDHCMWKIMQTDINLSCE